MRVAIDARELQGQPTGVGRYITGLLSAWADLPSARSHEFLLCAPGPIRLPPESAPVATCIRAGWARSGGTLWEQLTLPSLVRETGAQVLFAPAYTGPLRCPVPMVLAIHDVSFAAHPEWFPRREGARRRLLTRLSARRAARVLTISEFSKREIGRLLRTDAAKIEVGYPGAASFPWSGERSPGPRENLVLFVGSLFARRHVPALIGGFARLANARADVRLEIVGDNRTTPRVDFDRLVRDSGVAPRVALRSYVPETVLHGLYARARAFVFLSEYEGFGLTPVEALAAGIPIVVLDTPVAREVYGEAASYVPRPDPALVGRALERVLFDEAERARILEAAARLLPRYSWRACGERVLNALVASV